MHRSARTQFRTNGTSFAVDTAPEESNRYPLGAALLVAAAAAAAGDELGLA